MPTGNDDKVRQLNSDYALQRLMEGDAAKFGGSPGGGTSMAPKQEAAGAGQEAPRLSGKRGFMQAMNNSLNSRPPSMLILGVQMPGGERELIIDHDVPAKLAYIDRAYDDEMKLKSCPEIKIINALYVPQVSPLLYKAANSRASFYTAFKRAQDSGQLHFLVTMTVDGYSDPPRPTITIEQQDIVQRCRDILQTTDDFLFFRAAPQIQVAAFMIL